MCCIPYTICSTPYTIYHVRIVMFIMWSFGALVKNPRSCLKGWWELMLEVKTSTSPRSARTPRVSSDSLMFSRTLPEIQGISYGPLVRALTLLKRALNYGPLFSRWFIMGFQWVRKDSESGAHPY